MLKKYLIVLFFLFTSALAQAHSGGVWVANDGCGHWYAIVFHYHSGGSSSSVSSSGSSGLYIDYDQNGFFDVNGVQYAYTSASGFSTSDGEFTRFTDWIDLTDKNMSPIDYMNDTDIRNEVLTWLNTNKNFGKSYELDNLIAGPTSSTWYEALVCPIQPLSPGTYKASTSTSSAVESPYNYTNPFDLEYNPSNFTSIDPSQSISGSTLGISSTITQTCVTEYGIVYSYVDTNPTAGADDVTEVSIWSGSATDLVNEAYSYTINADANTEHLPYYVRSFYKQEVSGESFYVYSSVLEVTPLDPDEDYDNDGISNGDEISGESIDTDGDGTPDYKDTDSDNDGTDDADEGGTDDCDGDGTPDFQDQSILPELSPTGSTICAGASTTISIAEEGTGLTYQWQVDDGSGFVDITADATYSDETTRILSITAVPASIDGYLYRCTVTSAACGVSENTSSATLTVNSTATPTVSDVQYYMGETSESLSNYVTGTDLLWYTAETGGASSGTAPTPSTATVGDQEYWVTQTVDGCESERAKITVSVSPPNEISGTLTSKSAFYQLTSSVDSLVEVTGDADITNARVYIKSGFQSGDKLVNMATLPSGISSSYNSSTGSLSFTGTATSAEWQEIFRNVGFLTTSSNTDDREISFVISDLISLSVDGKSHFYKYVSGSYDWPSAKADAEAQSLYGMTGYLATITSSEENDFITDKLLGDGWLGGSDEYQEVNTALGSTVYATQNDSEGNFYWVMGPEAGTAISTGNTSPVAVSNAYMNWLVGEPNDAVGGEHYIHMNASLGGQWNDYSATNGYVLEFGGYSDDPTLNIEHTRTLSYNTESGIAISQSDIDENNTVGDVIGELTATGSDDILTLTYQLVSGTGATNNSDFTIDADDLKAASAFNYESANAYSIRVKVTDAFSGSYEAVLSISVNDINDTPTDITLSANTIDENTAAGIEIGTLSTTDEDAGDTFTYSFVSGGDEASFAIDGDKLETLGALDFETKDTYSVTIRTTDAGSLTYDEVFEITVNDINETPTDIALSANSIDENTAAGTEIGTFTTTDVDAGDTFTYTFVSGGDEASFAIDGDKLETLGALDFETKETYSVTIRTTDAGGLTYDEVFEITVNDINETATDIALSETSDLENKASGTVIGTFTTTDEDADDTHTYSFVSGSDEANFEIVDDVLTTTTSFNYEVKDSYSVTIRTTDAGGLSFDKTFTIEIEDINEVATDITLSANTVAENETEGVTIGTFTTTDEDKGDTHTYSFVSGSDETNFEIVGDALITATTFDYELQASYSVIIRTTDAGGLSFDKTFTIEIEDVNEAPTDIALSANTVYENHAVGTVIGSFSATDEDSPETHTYSFVSGADEAAFTIVGDELQTAESFDFETKDSYSVTVLVTDKGGLTFSKDFIITILDVNDAPSFAEIDDQSIRVSDYPQTITITDIIPGVGHELSQSLTLTVTSSDVDILADPEVSFVDGSTTATITYQASSQLESGTVTITVTLTDNGGTANGGVDTYVQTFEISVEAPNGSVFIPNTFTPNGDGNNDYFRVRGESLSALTFRVFNSLGEMVYSTDDVYEATNVGWDGSINGNKAPVGTYTWQIEGTFENGAAIELDSRNIGVVNLLK